MIRNLCAEYKPYKIHPGVILNILNFYTRREEGNDRVVGALLGNERENFIEIRECFPIVETPQEEDEEIKDVEFSPVEMETPAEGVEAEFPSPTPSGISDISSISTTDDSKKKKRKKSRKSAIDEQRAQNFYMLFRQLFPRQQLMGWFSTSTELSPNDFPVTESFLKITPKPVLLLVDPFSQKPMKCLQFQKLSLKKVEVGSVHFPVSIDFVMNENEKLALSQYMMYGKDITKVKELEVFRDELSRMMRIMKKIEEFLSIKESSSEINEIKIEIAKTHALLDTHAELDDHFDERLNSLLTMMYLTNICQSHVEMLERAMKKNAYLGSQNIQKERRSGERRSGERRSGERRSGDRRSGDKRYGDKRYGDKRSGDKRYGDRRSGGGRSGGGRSGGGRYQKSRY